MDWSRHHLQVPHWGSCSHVRPHDRWITWVSPTLVLGSYPSGMERHHATSAIICRDVPLEGIQETAYNAGVWKKTLELWRLILLFFQRIRFCVFLPHLCTVLFADLWVVGNPATVSCHFSVGRWAWLKIRLPKRSQTYSVLVNHFEAFWAINHITALLST